MPPQFKNFDPAENETGVAPDKVVSFDIDAGVGGGVAGMYKFLAVSQTTPKLYERRLGNPWTEFSPQPPWGAGASDPGDAPFGLPDRSIIVKIEDGKYAHYDPSTNLWTTRMAPVTPFAPTTPTACGRSGWVNTAGELYVVNAQIGDGKPAAVNKWDPVTATWSFVPGGEALGSPIANWPSLVIAGGNVWIAYDNKLWRYDGGGVWTNFHTAAGSAIGIANHSITSLWVINDELYVSAYVSVGTAGIVYKQSGGSWSLVGAPFNQLAMRVWGSSPTSIFTFGYWGTNTTIWSFSGSWAQLSIVGPAQALGTWLRCQQNFLGYDPEIWAFHPNITATGHASLDSGASWGSQVWSFGTPVNGLGLVPDVSIDGTKTLISANGVLAYENETERNGFTVARTSLPPGYHYSVTSPSPWPYGSDVLMEATARDTADDLAQKTWSFRICDDDTCFAGPLNVTESALLVPFTSLDFCERLRQALLQASVTRPNATTAARVVFLNGHAQELAPVLRDLVPSPTAAEKASRLCYRATNLAISNFLRRKANLLPGAIRELSTLGLPKEHAALLTAYAQEDQPNTEVPLACLIVLLAKALV